MPLKPGDPAPSFEAVTTTGATLSLAQLKGKFTILSFHRYVGCPLCNLAIRSFAKSEPEVLSKGLNVVNIFESSDENLKQALTIWGDKDFPVIADPTAKIFSLYGVETSVIGALKSFVVHLPQVIESYRTPRPKIKKDATDLRLPASFFISPDLKIFDTHYAKHPGDHLTPAMTERWLNVAAVDSGKRPLASTPHS